MSYNSDYPDNEADHYREKVGRQPGNYPPDDYDDFYREKGMPPTGYYAPPPPPRRNPGGVSTGLLVGLIVLVVVLAITLTVLVTLLVTGFFNAPGNKTVVIFATPTAEPTTASVFVPRPTTTITTFASVPTSTPAVATDTTTAPFTTAPVTTNASSDPDTIFNAGNVAFNAGKWDEVIANLEKLSPSDGPYVAAKPLLVKSYANLAQSLIDGQDNSQDNAKRTLDLYNKALALDSNNTDISSAKDIADNYLKGRTFFDSRQWQDAFNTLNTLYSNIKATSPTAKYRDTAEMLYNSLIQLGDIQLAQNQLDDARNKYQQAQTLDVADKSVAQTKLADIDQRQRQTQTAARPTATPRPTPAPTPSPTPTCRSNFFAFNVAQPTVPNVPDKGSSKVEGRVLNKTNQPIAGAVIRASSGTFTFTTTTDGGGNYRISGLGRARWETVVLSAPGYSICTSLSAGVNLSGEATFIARVEFVESVP